MITSTSNKQVKHIVQLQKKARMRREENVFIAEGPRMVMETPGDMLQEIYVAESFSENWDGPVDEVVSDAVMKAMSDTQTPQGVLAVVKRPSYTLEEILAVRPAHLLLIEEIQDPGNLVPFPDKRQQALLKMDLYYLKAPILMLVRKISFCYMLQKISII